MKFWKRMRPWWEPQPSKLLCGSDVIDEFDSHTLPQKLINNLFYPSDLLIIIVINNWRFNNY